MTCAPRGSQARNRHCVSRSGRLKLTHHNRKLTKYLYRIKTTKCYSAANACNVRNILQVLRPNHWRFRNHSNYIVGIVNHWRARRTGRYWHLDFQHFVMRGNRYTVHNRDCGRWWVSEASTQKSFIQNRLAVVDSREANTD